MDYVDGLKDLQVGDTVLFGKYEQDNNKSNGSERIQWVVLKRDGNKALVISVYALDSQPYNETETDVTWETCTLRNWLNTTFLNAAFSDAEKSLIPAVTVAADCNPDEDTDPGKATKDHVFLLSIPEVYKYFGSNISTVCSATDYAWYTCARHVAENDGYSSWWLRSPGDYSDYAAYVRGEASSAGKYYFPAGEVVTYGFDVEDDDFVRPAMWIDLKP